MIYLGVPKNPTQINLLNPTTLYLFNKAFPSNAKKSGPKWWEIIVFEDFWKKYNDFFATLNQNSLLPHKKKYFKYFY